MVRYVTSAVNAVNESSLNAVFCVMLGEMMACEVIETVHSIKADETIDIIYQSCSPWMLRADKGRFTQKKNTNLPPSCPLEAENTLSRCTHTHTHMPTHRSRTPKWRRVTRSTMVSRRLSACYDLISRGVLQCHKAIPNTSPNAFCRATKCSIHHARANKA